MKTILISILLACSQPILSCEICQIHMLTLFEDSILHYHDSNNDMNKKERKFYLKGYLQALQDCYHVLYECPNYYSKPDSK